MDIESNQRPHPLLQLGILFVLVGLCGFLCAALAALLLPLLFGIADANKFIVSAEAQKQHTYAALFIQSLASTWGLFLLPALIFTQILRFDFRKFFKIAQAPKLSTLFIAMIVMLLSGVFVNILIEIMKVIPLPDSLSYLRHGQDKSEGLIASFFSENTLSHFLILSVVLALLPAIAEELFFRGVMQTTLQQTNLGATGGIVVAALSFSCMHLQFDNSLAIFFMGVVLGLLYHYTQNLWISIVAHFVNNFLMVALKFAFANKLFTTNFSESDSMPKWVSLLAGICVLVLLYFLKKRNSQTINQPFKSHL